MIKPAYLWALCKTCKDSKWIGDICRSLGGQSVDLDFGQQQVADIIKMDSDWMDERINWKREAARLRQARLRERREAQRRQLAEDGADEAENMGGVTRDMRDKDVSREVTPPSHHPSIHPSIHPSNNSGEYISGAGAPDTRESQKDDAIPPYVPTLDEVLAAAKRKKVDAEWAKKWYEEMHRRDFAYISQGATVPISRRNFVTCMMSWLGKERKSGGAEGQMPLGTIHHEEGFDVSKLGI